MARLTMADQQNVVRLAYSLEAISARLKLAVLNDDKTEVFVELMNLDAVSELFKKKVNP